MDGTLLGIIAVVTVILIVINLITATGKLKKIAMTVNGVLILAFLVVFGLAVYNGAQKQASGIGGGVDSSIVYEGEVDDFYSFKENDKDIYLVDTKGIELPENIKSTKDDLCVRTEEKSQILDAQIITYKQTNKTIVYIIDDSENKLGAKGPTQSYSRLLAQKTDSERLKIGSEANDEKTANQYSIKEAKIITKPSEVVLLNTSFMIEINFYTFVALSIANVIMLILVIIQVLKNKRDN